MGGGRYRLSPMPCRSTGYSAHICSFATTSSTVDSTLRATSSGPKRGRMVRTSLCSSAKAAMCLFRTRLADGRSLHWAAISCTAAGVNSNTEYSQFPRRCGRCRCSPVAIKSARCLRPANLGSTPSSSSRPRRSYTERCRTRRPAGLCRRGLAGRGRKSSFPEVRTRANSFPRISHRSLFTKVAGDNEDPRILTRQLKEEKKGCCPLYWIAVRKAKA